MVAGVEEQHVDARRPRCDARCTSTSSPIELATTSRSRKVSRAQRSDTRACSTTSSPTAATRPAPSTTTSRSAAVATAVRSLMRAPPRRHGAPTTRSDSSSSRCVGEAAEHPLDVVGQLGAGHLEPAGLAAEARLGPELAAEVHLEALGLLPVGVGDEHALEADVGHLDAGAGVGAAVDVDRERVVEGGQPVLELGDQRRRRCPWSRRSRACRTRCPVQAIVPRRNSLGRTSRPSACSPATSGSTSSLGATSRTTSFCCAVSRTRPEPCRSARSRDGVQDRAADATHRRRCADVVQAVVLRVDADVVASTGVRGRGRAVEQRAAEVLRLDHLAELLRAPVVDEELQPGPGAQPAVAVVAEDRDDRLPDVGDVLERHPDAEALGEHRVGRQAATDVDVEAGAVLGVHDADERHVVDLVRDVLARRARHRGLELARQVGEPRVADVAAHDLLDRRVCRR